MHSKTAIATADVIDHMSMTDVRVAVVIPCLDEAANIAQVINDFSQALPDAEIYVYDNASDDSTADAARAAGARVRSEPRKGKGHVVRRMFRDVEADVYVMVDGDNTYDAFAAQGLITRLLNDRLDVIIGKRVADVDANHRRGHRTGNRVLTGFVANLFGRDIQDMLSGYRVMSRRFVKSFPVASTGFEIETEMTIHMLQVDAPFAEVETAYSDRDDASESKLRTVPDGIRVVRIMLKLMAFERPFTVFGAFGVISLIVATFLFIPIVQEFFETGEVPRFPTLIASAALMMSGLTSIFAGLILLGVSRVARDAKRIFYLDQPSQDQHAGTKKDGGNR